MLKDLTSIEPIMAQVKLMLKSFDEVGLVDDASLFTHAEWVINRLDSGIQQEHQLVLQVDNGIAETPFNLRTLDIAYKCKSCDDDYTDDVRFYFGHPHKYIVRDHLKKICYNSCCIKEEHTEVEQTIEIHGKKHVRKYCEKELLTCKDSVSRNLISDGCKNLFCKSPNFFNLDKKNFYFNFDKGFVFIKYQGYPLDENGFPMIPDDPYITKALVDYMIYQSFLSIYYNGDGDVFQRMQKAELEHKISLKEALFNDKLPDYKRHKSYSKEKGKSFKIFDLKSKADAIQHNY